MVGVYTQKMVAGNSCVVQGGRLALEKAELQAIAGFRNWEGGLAKWTKDLDMCGAPRW